MLHHGQYAFLLAQLTDDFDPLFHIQFLLQADGTRNLEITETIYFGATQQFVVQCRSVFALMQSLVDAADVLQLMQEPFVYLCQVMDMVDAIALAHGLGDNKDALVGGFVQGRVDVGNFQFLVLYETMHPLPYHAQSLLQGLLECAADGHDLSDGLHRRTQFAVNATELAQVPTWNLAYNVVERRLEESRSLFCHGVLQVEEPIAKSQFCCDKGQWITCGLAG